MRGREGGRWGEGGEINIIEKMRESEGRDIWRNGKGRAGGPCAVLHDSSLNNMVINYIKIICNYKYLTSISKRGIEN